MIQTIKTIPTSERQTESAGLGARAGSLLLDFFVLFLVHLGGFLFVAGVLVQTTAAGDLQHIFGAVLFYVFLFLISPPLLAMMYFIILNAFGGQTIGKLILGLRVVSSSDGGTISIGVAFLRWAGAVVSALPLAMGFIWAIIDREHCTWHDRLSGTRVVATRKILTSV